MNKSIKAFFGSFVVVLLLVSFFSSSSVVQTTTAAGTTNPDFNIDPQAMFPNKTALLPSGITYVDTVPDTLDLAERAKWYIRGSSQAYVPFQNIWIPAAPGVFNSAAPAASECQSIPCLGKSGGYQNWGKLTLGMVLAREMTPYDRTDTDGTLNAELRSFTTMLSWDTWPILQTIGGGGFNLVFGQRFTTPATVAMQSLIARYKQDPNNLALKVAIDEYVKMHKNLLSPQTINGKTYFNFLDPLTDTVPDSQKDTFTGYNGKYWIFAFVNGRAALAMFDWYNLTGNQDAFDVGSKLTAYLRDFQPLWQNPDTSRFPNEGPGQFQGHIHSYLQVAHAYLAEAEARRKTNPLDPIAQEDINRAKDMYDFMKRRTKGDILGNFGVMDNVDDMIRVGLKLEDFNAESTFDEIERWTRNQLAEGQIDSFTGQNFIPNFVTNDYSTDRVGSKVTGLWFSDATHSLAIPSATQMFNLDDATNPMHAMYEVWDHIVQIKDSFAQINFNLNRASQYLDVKSDLPYRGKVMVTTKSDIGPIANMGIRVPSWADKNSVSVSIQDSSGERPLAFGTDWTWISSGYVSLAAIKSNTSYIIRFPIKVSQQQFNDIYSANQFWYEGSHGSPGFSETLQTFTGTFRGDTLVDATPRPTGGIPRYQRQTLAQLPASDIAPPTLSLERFVMQSIQSLPPVPIITSPAAASGTIGVSFSYQITATNNPTFFNAAGLPAGLFVDTTTGIISGIPTVSGTFDVQIKGVNQGGSRIATLTLMINPASAPENLNSTTTIIESPGGVMGIVGVPFSYQVNATNNPTSFSATGLPTGLSINKTTGLIKGIPILAGTFRVTLKATNAKGSGTYTWALTINLATSNPNQTFTPTPTPMIPVVPNLAPTISTSGEKVTVTARVLNVRSGPGRRNKIITTVRLNNILEKVEVRSGWIKVVLPNGQSGWIYKKFTK